MILQPILGVIPAKDVLTLGAHKTVDTLNNRLTVILKILFMIEFNFWIIGWLEPPILVEVISIWFQKESGGARSEKKNSDDKINILSFSKSRYIG